MSWIWGAISENLSSQTIKQFKAIHSGSLISIDSPGLYLAAGGIKETCLYGSLSPSGNIKKEGWLVVGMGLKKIADDIAIFEENDWRSILSSPDPNLNIDGHFAAVKWRESKIQCFTDQLGIRSLYILKKDNAIVFSTRLDWLAKLRGDNLIDWQAFGASWLTLN